MSEFQKPTMDDMMSVQYEQRRPEKFNHHRRSLSGKFSMALTTESGISVV